MIRFGHVLKKYEVSYVMVRTPEGEWDLDGKYVPAAEIRLPRRGCIQPIGARLYQLLGGRYTMDDRVIYTTVKHNVGDVLEYKGMQYTIDGEDDRSEYNDVYKYMAKLVTTHSPIIDVADPEGVDPP